VFAHNRPTVWCVSDQRSATFPKERKKYHHSNKMFECKKVQIETYGCAMNRADSEVMAGFLAENGFEICEDGEILIINTCTVKTPTERKIIKRLRELENSDKRVIVTGCLPAADPKIAERFPRFSFLGTNVSDIVKAVKNTLNGRRFIKIDEDNCRLDFPRIRSNPFIEIIPISQGCLGNCAYCIVKKARGKLRSCPEDLILEDVENAIRDGVKEIWLTSQDTGAYGLDTGKNLPELLQKIFGIRGRFMLRVGMMTPNHAMKFLDELIRAYKNEKIYRFLHIPVQSGDNNVLGDMNRRYRIEDFKRIVKEFRKNIPQITISTDIIAGFPTEDEYAFQNSLNLIKEIKPEILNISRFWRRPGTGAEKMKPLHGRITKERSRRLFGIFKDIALEKNNKWVGWKGKALVSEKGKTGGFCARNFAYKPIILKSEKNLLGKFVNVIITEATYYDLRGEIIP